MDKSNNITWDEIVKIGVDLQSHKDTQTKSYFNLFENANYERGDKIILNSVFFMDAKIPELVAHRISHNEYIDYGKYIVLKGNKPQMNTKLEFNYGLALNNKSLIACAQA
jgi:hypothetical protein